MSARSESHRPYTIRIAAGDSSEKSIAVQGAIYGAGEASIKVISGFTPLELATSGGVVCGMVQAVDTGAQVMVDVFSGHPSAELRLLMRGRARTVLLGEQLTQTSGRFIRGAP
ncbi:MAG: hypothetical protein ABJF01_18520 [bacterium]